MTFELQEHKDVSEFPNGNIFYRNLWLLKNNTYWWVTHNKNVNKVSFNFM